MYKLHPLGPNHQGLKKDFISESPKPKFPSDCYLLYESRLTLRSVVGYMKVRGLMLVLLVPWVVHAEEPYYGSRVASLALSGAESETDLLTVPLKVGDSITPENVRASIQKLYDTGKYSYIEVDATPAGQGTTNLTFRVQPHFFFSTFRLEPANLLERSLSGYFRLPLGEKFTTSAVDRIIEDATELLKSEGYFEVKITPEYDRNQATRLVFVTLRAEPGPKATIADVRIQGGQQTFSPKELLQAMNLHSGDDFVQTKLDKSIAAIRAKFTDLGFLNTRVNVDRQYTAAMHTVDLNLTIQPGQFTLVEPNGFDISKKKLRELVPIFEEGAVDQDLVAEGRMQIERYMQQEGYFEATVDSQVIEAPLDNAIQINYNITPGVSHHIESVSILGNKQISTEEIRKRIKIRKGSLFSRGVFSRELLDQDVRTIEAMYRNGGYEGTSVRGSYGERDHAIDVVIQTEEGTRLPVDFVTFLGNFAVPDQELRRKIVLKENDVYTPVAVDQARAALMELYYSKGYADVRVEPSVDRTQTNNGVRVTFQISEGEAYQIGSILVAGNTLTKEKIIHRNSSLYPNTPYNPEAILEGQRKLYATGLFNRVEIVSLEQNLQRIRNLLIQVEDAKPISVTYGIGFQEYEHARATVDLSHNNLFGLDRSLSFRVRGSQRERLFQTTYREPKLFNHDLDGFASTFIEHTERPFLNANRIDFSLQVLKRFSPQQNVLFTSSYQTVNLGDFRVNLQAQTIPPEQGPCWSTTVDASGKVTTHGTCQIARVGTSFIQDRRNDPLNPSAGSFSTTTFQLASRAFGSELNFTSLFNQSSFYSPVPHGVLATSFRLGWNHPFGITGKNPFPQLPPTERYFAGGSTTLRGFSFDKAEPSGGNIMTIGNVEYRVPLRIFPIPGVGGALFYDTGNVFKEIRDIHLRGFTHAAGFGLRYQTPVGPVRVDFGVNLKPRKTIENTMEDRFHVFFTLGNPF